MSVAEHQISKAFHPFGYVQRTLIDKQYWQALVRFETIEACTRAFAEMHGKQLLGKRLLVGVFLHGVLHNCFKWCVSPRNISMRRVWTMHVLGHLSMFACFFPVSGPF